VALVQRPKLNVASIHVQPLALIQTRSDASLSQEELAERPGLKEQQIQRYEATADTSASLTRVCEVARSIGLKAMAEMSVAIDPEGIAEISRGLSAATPPVGCCCVVASRRDASTKTIWHPSGMRAWSQFRTGGIASLNPRLMAGIPFGMQPQALIQGRIAAGLSQKELAERLGLKEQQIQRYDATDYASASLTRVCEVARSLGLKVKAEASFANLT
jgi:transcriptional regulator with XRE-family HTH domain